MGRLFEPIRDIIGRALYEEEPDGQERDWYTLSEKQREPWRLDGDRVIGALKDASYEFTEFAYSRDGIDWLATTPDELWRDWWEHIQKTRVPRSTTDFC